SAYLLPGIRRGLAGTLHIKLWLSSYQRILQARPREGGLDRSFESGHYSRFQACFSGENCFLISCERAGTASKRASQVAMGPHRRILRRVRIPNRRDSMPAKNGAKSNTRVGPGILPLE